MRYHYTTILTVFIAVFSFSLSAQTDHIGLWEGEDAGEVGYISFGESGYAFMVFEKDTMGGESFMQNGVECYMKYRIDYSKTANELDMLMYLKDNDKELGGFKGIFRFDEEDHLIFCVNFNGEERPTDFAKADCITMTKIKEYK